MREVEDSVISLCCNTFHEDYEFIRMFKLIRIRQNLKKMRILQWVEFVYSLGPTFTRLSLGVFYIVLFQAGNILFSDDFFFTPNYQVRTTQLTIYTDQNLSSVWFFFFTFLEKFGIFQCLNRTIINFLIKARSNPPLKGR